MESRSEPGSARRRATFGLVTELVQREALGGGDEDHAPPPPMGVIRVGEQATVCRVEHVPVVGDVIHGAVSGIVQKVQIGRNGRVSIFASPLAAPEA